MIVSAIVFSLQNQEKGGILRQDLQGAAAEGNSGRSIGGNIDVNTDRLTPKDNVDKIEPETDSMEDEILKPKKGTNTVVSNEDISTYNKEICVTNYENYNVDNVVIRHERGSDTVDVHKDTLSGIKDDIKLEASGSMDGVT